MTTEEKRLEKALVRRVKAIGGMSIKLVPDFVRGLPDQLCLFPGGAAVFVEVKDPKLKPEPMQKYIMRRIAQLNFQCYVLQTDDTLEEIMSHAR